VSALTDGVVVALSLGSIATVLARTASAGVISVSPRRPWLRRLDTSEA
jgi:hypothetical protein